MFLTGVDKLNMPKGGTPSEMIRLNMSIPPCSSMCSRLGVLGGDLAGFERSSFVRRHHRRVLRVVLEVLPNHQAIAETIGDGVDTNDVSFNTQFPYVAYPHSGSDADPHDGATGPGRPAGPRPSPQEARGMRAIGRAATVMAMAVALLVTGAVVFARGTEDG